MTPFLAIFGISLAAWLLFEIWVFLRDRGKDRGAQPAEARRAFAVLAIAVALAMNVPGIFPMFDVRANYAVYFWIGIVLIWAGILLRLWSVRTLGRFFAMSLVIQEGHGLVTSGPYRFIRNPSYAAGLITMSGLGIALGNGISLALLVVTALLVYVPRIRAEEKMLRQAFGSSFEEYKKRSWRLVPFVW
jgi:protein-S-isoprenylcysteine O-methyltransferase Ste14